MLKRISLVLFLILCLFLSACSGGTPEAASADKVLQDSRNCGRIVFEDLEMTQGSESWENFYSSSQNGSPCSVELAYYYTLDSETTDPEYYEAEKENYPVIYLAELAFDGEVYNIKVWNSDKTVLDCDKTYKYLMHYTAKSSLPNAEMPKYDHYILVNDNNVTYEEIEYGLLSSRLGDNIDHYSIWLNNI